MLRPDLGTYEKPVSLRRIYPQQLPEQNVITSVKEAPFSLCKLQRTTLRERERDDGDGDDDDDAGLSLTGAEEEERSPPPVRSSSKITPFR